MKHIILLRHGVTKENQSAVIQGQTDGQLTELGREQARAAGRRLSEQNIDRAVTSDLARARETLLEVLKFVDCPWTTDKRLRERNFGQFHGRTRDDYAQFVHQRVLAFLDEAAATPGDGALLAVTHGGVVRHLLTQAHQRPLTDVGQFHTDNASITEFLVAADGTIDIVRMNDTSHLGEGLKGPRLEMI